MRIAVISDIHGNALALQAVLNDLTTDQFDQAVCLGDAVQGGAQPAETVALLRELGWPVVLGNADYWLVTGDDASEPSTPDWMKAIREWSVSKLTEDDQAFIHGFQSTVDIPLPDGRTLRCAHGTPSSFHEVILPETPDEAVRGMLGVEDEVVYCGGHTHTQQVRRLGLSLFFNPGSVGLPFIRDGAAGAPNVYGWAEYAMVTASDDGRFAVEFRQVPYDIPLAIQIVTNSGMPEPERMTRRFPGGAPNVD